MKHTEWIWALETPPVKAAGAAAGGHLPAPRVRGL